MGETSLGSTPGSRHIAEGIGLRELASPPTLFYEMSKCMFSVLYSSEC